MNRWTISASVLALVACTFDPSTRSATDSGPFPVDADRTLTDSGLPAADAGTSVDAAPGQADAVAPDAAACPPDYVQNGNGSCYRFVTASATWPVAEADCEDDAVGAHLVVIDDANEDAMVPSFHWIGYTERVTNNVFLWVNGSTGAYPGFEAGEPVSGGAACVVTRPGGWHDDNCTESKVYLCEFDGMPAIATTY